MQGRRVVFHSVLVYLLWRGADVELLLLGEDDDIPRRTVIGRIGHLVGLYLTNPFLPFEHPVKGCIDIHPLRVSQLWSLETVKDLVVLLLVDLFQIGLVDVEDHV